MDIAQDTSLKFLSRIQQFRSDANFDTWLYRLVVNSCLDYQRRRRKVAPIIEGLLDAMCAARDTVLQRLVREEREVAVQQVIGNLPPEQRIVILLRYTEELPYENIAEILGCSMGTVASRLNRAHKVLEKRLSRFRDEEDLRVDGSKDNKWLESVLRGHLGRASAPDEFWDRVVLPRVERRTLHRPIVWILAASALTASVFAAAWGYNPHPLSLKKKSRISVQSGVRHSGVGAKSHRLGFAPARSAKFIDSDGWRQCRG